MFVPQLRAPSLTLDFTKAPLRVLILVMLVIPDDVVFNILQFLDIEEILAMRKVRELDRHSPVFRCTHVENDRRSLPLSCELQSASKFG